jgi:hypothetical protein
MATAVFVVEVDNSLILSMVEQVLKGRHCVAHSMTTVAIHITGQRQVWG